MTLLFISIMSFSYLQIHKKHNPNIMKNNDNTNSQNRFPPFYIYISTYSKKKLIRIDPVIINTNPMNHPPIGYWFISYLS